MKNLISIVNTSSEVTINGVTFPQGVPVMVYRNRSFWGQNDWAVEALNLLLDGTFVSYSFDGTANSVEESIALYNQIVDDVRRAAHKPSYSADYNWYQISSAKLTEGFLGQLDAFDFDGVDVTMTRPEVIAKVEKSLCLLGVGYLKDASVAVAEIVPDTDDDFLSAARLAQFEALFISASS